MDSGEDKVPEGRDVQNGKKREERVRSEIFTMKSAAHLIAVAGVKKENPAGDSNAGEGSGGKVRFIKGSADGKNQRVKTAERGSSLYNTQETSRLKKFEKKKIILPAG